MTTLRDIAYVRSGDKGDVCTVGLIARSPEHYESLRRTVTPERVKRLLGEWATGDVRVWAMDNIEAVLVAVHGGIGGGATATLRLDQTGKALGYALLRLQTEESA
ncbi:MAG: hypothetical protein ACHQ06_01595 [Candidatus Dormibacteria bacterium]|jgi:hypothetical protein